MVAGRIGIEAIKLAMEGLKVRFGKSFDAFFDAVDNDPRVKQASEALEQAAARALEETGAVKDFLVQSRVSQLERAAADVDVFTDELLERIEPFLPTKTPPPPPPLTPRIPRFPSPRPEPTPIKFSPSGRRSGQLRGDPGTDVLRFIDGFDEVNRAMEETRLVARDAFEDIEAVGPAAAFLAGALGGTETKSAKSRAGSA